MTKQKIVSYYELFRSIDVTFSKEIIQVTGLVSNQVFLKCVGDFWPCVIYSTSFQGAKVVVNIKSGILQKLERANNMMSLRFCFKIADKGNPVAFFVNTKSLGYTLYGGSEDMAIFNLQYTQRPPDDLIEIIGRILDANVNSAKRRAERITITADSARKLNLTKESSVFIQGVPRHCILRDISFFGAKIIMMGVAKFLINKEAVLKADFEDPKEAFLLKGKFVRAELVEGRKELVSLAIDLDEAVVPMGYKIRINDYLSQVRADSRGTENTPGEKQAGKKSSIPQPAAKRPISAAKPAVTDWPSPDEAASAGLSPKPAAPASPAPAVSPAPSDDDFDLKLPSR